MSNTKNIDGSDMTFDEAVDHLNGHIDYFDRVAQEIASEFPDQVEAYKKLTGGVLPKVVEASRRKHFGGAA